MARILVIDNYPFGGDVRERLSRFREILKDFDFEIVGFDKLNERKVEEFDKFILSGSNLSLRLEENIEKYKNEIEFIQKTEKPILGICFGHQLIGVAFGFKVRKMEDGYSEYGTDIKLRVKPFELCKKDEIMVEENHHEEIEHDPDFEKIFSVLGKTEHCKIEVLKHRSKKIFGVQFHPETNPKSNIKEDGEELIKNFINLN